LIKKQCCLHYVYTDNKKGFQKNSETLATVVSGYQDSNLGPPAPKAGALTGLRYTPNYPKIYLLSYRNFVAEREGFEPSVQFNPYVSLANWWFQPLTHLSNPSFQKTDFYFPLGECKYKKIYRPAKFFIKIIIIDSLDALSPWLSEDDKGKIA
jgi:hypothetical protein